MIPHATSSSRTGASSSIRWVTSSVVAVATAILFFFDPTKFHFYPPCVFHQLTGLQCPGCGATRAVFHLLHGDIAGAFRLNQFLFLVVPFVMIGMQWPSFLKRPAVAWTAVFVTAGYGVIRNLPFWPYPL